MQSLWGWLRGSTEAEEGGLSGDGTASRPLDLTRGPNACRQKPPPPPTPPLRVEHEQPRVERVVGSRRAIGGHAELKDPVRDDAQVWESEVDLKRFHDPVPLRYKLSVRMLRGGFYPPTPTDNIEPRAGWEQFDKGTLRGLVDEQARRGGATLPCVERVVSQMKFAPGGTRHPDSSLVMTGSRIATALGHNFFASQRARKEGSGRTWDYMVRRDLGLAQEGENEHTLRGKQNEAEALRLFSLVTGLRLHEGRMGFMCADQPRFGDGTPILGGTIDGLCACVPWIVEVKCPKVANRHGPRRHEYDQVQVYLNMLAPYGIRSCVYISYTVTPVKGAPRPHLSLNIWRINLDPARTPLYVAFAARYLWKQRAERARIAAGGGDGATETERGEERKEGNTEQARPGPSRKGPALGKGGGHPRAAPERPPRARSRSAGGAKRMKSTRMKRMRRV